MNNTPQKEKGFLQIASGKQENDILSALISMRLNGTEYQIMLTVIRKTWGWNKKEDWISISQFEKITNKSRRFIINTIIQLVNKRLLVKKTALGKTTKLSIQKDITLWGKEPVNKSALVNKKAPTSELLLPRLVNKKAPTKDIYTKDTITKDNNTNVLQNGFGNPDVNEVIAYFKTTLGLPIMDGSVQRNRNYAQLCLKKFGGVDKVKVLIDSTKANTFWSTRITSLMDLYYKAVNIISSNRNQKWTVKTL